MFSANTQKVKSLRFAKTSNINQIFYEVGPMICWGKCKQNEVNKSDLLDKSFIV